MRTDLHQPCIECPFRRQSAAGWLGPWQATEIIAFLNVNAFPCHRTIKNNGQSIEDGSLQGCAGAAQFLNNQCKLSRDQVTADHQRKIGKRGPGTHPDVFDWPVEFVQHHKKRCG